MVATTPHCPQFPFTKLSRDLQHSVIESLCGHCTNREHAIAILRHNPRQQTNTLSSLCLVSRHMRALAEGVLYHFPRIYSYTDFFRTIQARPELAGYVKVLTWIYFEDMDRLLLPLPGKSSIPRENIWYLRSLATELKLSDLELRKFEETFSDYPQSADSEVSSNYDDGMPQAFDNLVTSIMLGLCPRLELASVNFEDAQEMLRRQYLPRNPVVFRYLPGLVQQRFANYGFRFLRTLVVQNTMQDKPNMLGIGSISCLLKALPNLQRLVFYRGYSEEYPDDDLPWSDDELDTAQSSLHSLKELTFTCYSRFEKPLPLPAIKDLVSRCTQLERFNFSPMGLEKDVFSPRKLIDALSSTTSTLRHLTINCHIAEIFAVGPREVISDLTQFTRLQSLVLDQPTFCHHHHHEIYIKPDCLTSILPESIYRLTINMYSPCTPVVDLVALGEAVSKGHFTNLRHLRAQMIFADQKDETRTSNSTPEACDSSKTMSDKSDLNMIKIPVLNCSRDELRNMLLQAFVATNVALDVACFSGCVKREFIAGCIPPEGTLPKFSINLVQET